MYPPSVIETNVNMNYPASVPSEKQMAIGQEVFGLLPGLSMYATLWLREHNRVCDILKKEHPTWEDEQLFQTTRLIIIGEVVAHFISAFLFVMCATGSKQEPETDSMTIKKLKCFQSRKS